MLRAIREIQPVYIVAENVYGFINWNGGMVFNEVQADLEAEGYEVQPVILPACAKNAPHRRDRIWFVAYNDSFRQQRYKELKKGFKHTGRRKALGELDAHVSFGDVADSNSERLQGNVCGKFGSIQDQAEPPQGSSAYRATSKDGGIWAIESSVGRVANGIPKKLDKNIDYDTIKKELLELWGGNDSTNMGKWRERFNFQEQEILQLSVLRIMDRKEVQSKEDEWKENCSKKVQINRMRELWIEKIITEASQRWKYEQQRKEEYCDSMPEMPQRGTHENRHMGNIWDEEPNIPRVASGVGNRVNRLKGLGNAIVPQIAYEIFKAINNINQ